MIRRAVAIMNIQGDFQGMEENQEIEATETESRDEEIFKIEEIKIEEVAIDGICGVY